MLTFFFTKYFWYVVCLVLRKKSNNNKSRCSEYVMQQVKRGGDFQVKSIFRFLAGRETSPMIVLSYH